MIPGTSPRLLGIVLVVVAVVSGAILIIIGRGKDDAARGRGGKAAGDDAGEAPEDRLARLLDRVTPNLVAMLSITVAGSLEIAGANGLYWLAAAVVLALGSGVINAWLFLTR